MRLCNITISQQKWQYIEEITVIVIFFENSNLLITTSSHIFAQFVQEYHFGCSVLILNISFLQVSMRLFVKFEPSVANASATKWISLRKKRFTKRLTLSDVMLVM